MKAMIMAAGVGSRLMPMTIDVPKPMIPMANQPLMANSVKLLRQHGFTSLIANLHYHADHITRYFGDGSDFGVSLQYSPEKELMGTAGGVKRCQWFLDDTFVVISGDALTDLALTSLVKHHKQKGALATMALKEVEDVESFGIVITGQDGLIKSFQEKPSAGEALSRLANTGIYVFETEIFNYIPANEFYDFGKQVFPELVSKGCPFYGYTIEEYWCDVGNLNAYRQAHADVMAGKVKIDMEGDIISAGDKSRVLVATGTEIGKNANFSGSVVIGARCRIGDNVTISDAVLWDDIEIGNDVSIHEAIVGNQCKISPGTIIKPGSALANGTSC